MLRPLSSPALFVSNLHLLNLHLRDDWPHITVETFTMKDVQQTQRRRTQCTEWALYHLFELWDVDVTHDKLLPFFPPLEPLKSLNLRGALHRCLSDLKKSGVLGRETMVRRTMLDECKGERFMETMIAFSSTVLKREISGRKSRQRNLPIAYQYATASILGFDQQGSLLPLIITHQIGLTKALGRRDDMRKKEKDFAEMLVQRKHDILERGVNCDRMLDIFKKTKIKLPENISIWRTLRQNWPGSPEWLEIIVHGENVDADDDFSRMSFEEVWHRVQFGHNIKQGKSRRLALLSDLEVQAQQQDGRLSSLQALLAEVQELLMETHIQQPSVTKASFLELHFDRHQYLRLDSKALNRKATSITSSSLVREYSSIVTKMHHHLPTMYPLA